MKRLLSLLLMATVMLCLRSNGVALTLFWDANHHEESVIAYRIYQRVRSSYEFIGTATAGALPAYVLPPLPEGVYTFVVTAVSACGESIYSKQLTVKVPVSFTHRGAEAEPPEPTATPTPPTATAAQIPDP